ncbi:MAG: peptide chain release factor 1 [Bacilli bacterium]|nr:peptide chain release factor 1 [Bacilli bacterium]MCI9433707.1 peptide chain release factor 1 [Bacilli bacterium]
MIERLDSIEQRYNQISTELLDPTNITDIKKMTELSKEQASIKEAYETYQEYKKILEDIDAAKEMLKDEEMSEFAKEELTNLETKKQNLESNFEILLLPKDPNDLKNVIVEIRGAAGGDEGNIFAGDLFEMYKKYAENENWKIDIIEEEHSEAGGYALISFMVKGESVYSKLKYESGAHRVQRVPSTETQGRVHTSTATVLVMPEAEEVDFTLDMNEVRIDITRSSGCGGQGVNTTDSAVRLTHIPTGLVVYSQTERSQIKNKEKAIKILQTRLYDLKNQEREQELGVERRSKIGTGDRSEKIRTYNYPQNRVTDHRIGFTLKQLDRVMDGDLGEIIEALIHEDQIRKLKGDI